MDYAKAIRIARAAARLQQNELAERAGIARSHLSLLEAGKRTPSLETLEALARELDVPLHLLMLLATEAKDLPEKHAHDIGEASRALLQILREAG